MVKLLTPWGCILLAFGVLLLPLRWIIAWSVVSIAHEAGHILTAKLLGGKVHGLSAAAWGARIRIRDLTPAAELATAMAGPLFGCIGLLLIPWLPEAGICAIFQGIYNLLPIYPLDGGRAINCILLLLAGEKTAAKALSVLRILCIGLLWVLTLIGVFWLKLGLLPIMGMLLLHIKTKIGNTP